jgi:hypothetical protein
LIHDGKGIRRCSGRWELGLGRFGHDQDRWWCSAIVVLPDGLVLRARVAVLQIAAAKLGRRNCAGMLLSGIALLLSRVAVL